MHIAYIRTATNISSMKDLAERISENSATDISNIKSNGFTLRQKPDGKVTDDMLEEAIYEAVSDILTEDIEESTDYISENYDFPFNPDDIHSEHLMELFDVSRDGRLIYVELDL